MDPLSVMVQWKISVCNRADRITEPRKPHNVGETEPSSCGAPNIETKSRSFLALRTRFPMRTRLGAAQIGCRRLRRDGEAASRGKVRETFSIQWRVMK